MSSSHDPPFRTVAVVGVGLIGGSIALGVRERWPDVRITGVDDPAVLAHALGDGAIDRGVSGVGELDVHDLIVLAAPVRANVALLPELSAVVPDAAIVTDVGGTKREIVEAADSVPFTFVGGHPIGGAEYGGFGFARPDLFRGRPWIFTPTARTPAEAVDRLSRLVAALGARPVILPAAEHDRVMAYVSHLPQIAASALMSVAGLAGGEALRLAGRGLVDTTRLASSPAAVWRDVCAANADAIGPALDAFIDRLVQLRRSLRDGDAVVGLFDDAARRRAELLAGREPGGADGREALARSALAETHVFHLTDGAVWEAACRRGVYTADSLATEGFIHCSDRHQVMRVANERFPRRQGLLLLQIDPGRVTAPLRYENLEGGTELFPHLYGPLNLDAVVAVTPLRVGPDGRFEWPGGRV